MALALELDCNIHALADAYGHRDAERDLTSEPPALPSELEERLVSLLEERLVSLVAKLTRRPQSSLAPLIQAIQEATSKGAMN